MPAKKKVTKVKTPPTVHIRWLLRRDFPEVLEIESSVGGFAWDENVLSLHLRQKKEVGMVAEVADKIVGHMVYALEKSRLILLNFVVHPQWRRLGVGRQMMERLVGKLSPERRNRIVAPAHDSRLDVHLFLRAMGFRCEGIEGEFYTMVRRVADCDDDEPVVTASRIAAYLE